LFPFLPVREYTGRNGGFQEDTQMAKKQLKKGKKLASAKTLYSPRDVASGD
jgi:hypothetical protein